MKTLTSVLKSCTLLLTGALIALGISAPVTARQNKVVRAIPIYDIGNAVEVGANGLEQQGWEVFAVQASGYYDNGTRRVLVWVKGYGEPPVPDYAAFSAYATAQADPNTGCTDYNATEPGIQGPFPGATCVNGGWR